MDLAQCQRAPEYTTPKSLLAESFLGDQLQAFNQSAQMPKVKTGTSGEFQGLRNNGRLKTVYYGGAKLKWKP